MSRRKKEILQDNPRGDKETSLVNLFNNTEIESKDDAIDLSKKIQHLVEEKTVERGLCYALFLLTDNSRNAAKRLPTFTTIRIRISWLLRY